MRNDAQVEGVNRMMAPSVQDSGDIRTSATDDNLVKRESKLRKYLENKIAGSRAVQPMDLSDRQRIS